MNFNAVWDYIVHLDSNLETLVDSAGIFAYLALFLVVFAETAFIVTVFLPGDTVLFASCALASVNHSLSFPLLLIIFFAAAVLGDSTNFSIGRKLRNSVEQNKRIIFIKKDKLDKANEFYEHNGTVTIVTARFIPVLRALAPFVAGVSTRSYRKFLKSNVIGVVMWDLLFCSLGYFFGNMSFVKSHFSAIVLGIAAMTILTATISMVVSRVFFKKK